MAWSQNPLAYPKLFHDILTAAEENRDRIVIHTAPGRSAKYKFQFYGFRDAWLKKAERSRKIQNFELAAEEEAKAAKLARYTPMIGPDSVTFINKEVALMEEGVSLEVSERSAPDDMIETIDMVAQDQAMRERAIASRKMKKADRPATPAPSMPVAQPENLALKLFGVDTTKAQKNEPIAPVPQTEEEKALLEQIRKELEESGNKHDE
jgi:hypothetical protein